MSFKMHLAGRPSVPWSQAAPQWPSQSELVGGDRGAGDLP